MERKFAAKLIGPGSAAKVRETVSSTVRENSCLTKPTYVEPLEYETIIVKNRTLLHNDPQREMLTFPHDDVSQSKLPRRLRTVGSSVPPNAPREANMLLVREAIKSYTAEWKVIHYKYSAYSGTYLQLPSNCVPTAFPEQVFEVDAVNEGKEEEETKKSMKQNITKKGWLFKGPDSSHDTSSSIISFTKSFKRRYFYLKQQADGTYLLEFHKDDKKIEAKGSIFLDSAIGVHRSSRRAKNTFELHMQDKKIYLLAAETDKEMEEWTAALKKVIAASDMPPGGHPHRESTNLTPLKAENFRESLEHSMNPELQKFARETDSVLTQQRKDGRQKLFAIFPDIQKRPCEDTVKEEEATAETEVYKEQFGKRFIVQCQDFTLRLQAHITDNNTETQSNPEPFFITLCLYDAKKGEKISEDFHWDPNTEDVRGMIPKESFMGATSNGASPHTPNSSLPNAANAKWLQYPKMAVFSVADPHPDIFLVARIEKILQGSVTACAEPYTRTPDVKLGTKLHRLMKVYCSKLGRYRMPFAWAAKSVFKPYSGELETYSDFALYRVDSSKITEEEILRQLNDFKRPERQNKLQSILGSLSVKLFPYKSMANSVTSSLVAVKPFPEPPTQTPVVEVEEFLPLDAKLAHPLTTYTNHLYVYPRALKYDSQKAFPKARNIAVMTEVRDSDDEGMAPLRVIYSGWGDCGLVTSDITPVLHHTTAPDFMHEVKCALPVQLHEKHHLVFKFYHVSCDLAKAGPNKSSAKKPQSIEMPVGYAWFPLLHAGRILTGEQNIRISTNLPNGYLAYESFGMGRGAMGPDVRWADTRQLFKFNLRLISTTYTKDQHLHNFFAHCQKLDNMPTPAVEVDTSNKLKHVSASLPAAANHNEALDGYGALPKDDFSRDMLTFVKQSAEDSPLKSSDPVAMAIESLHAVEVSTVIQFLPTLFTQLFRLLPRTINEDVAMNTVRALIHMVHEIHEAGKPDILQSYVKYVFVTEMAVSPKDKTIHEELVNNLNSLMRPQKVDPQVVKKLLSHAGFFFEVIIKSMGQHLLDTGRVKMARNERFPSSLQFRVMTLVQSVGTQITQKYREIFTETRNANISLANFIKRCFTFMDRGFVFRMINSYVEKFNPGDPKMLHEYKFEFLRHVCSHEHYIPLNLPLMRKHVKNYKDLKHDYTLSEEFRKNHFLVGLLLHELKLALNEIKDIRKVAVVTLRNLLAKHAFDDRYSNKSQQARIAALYLPFITIILENKQRLLPPDSTHHHSSNNVPNGDSISVLAGQADSVSLRPSLMSYNSTLSLDTTASTPSAALASLAYPSAGGKSIQDPKVFAMISGSQAQSNPSLAAVSGGSESGTLARHGSQTSLGSTSSGHSTATEKSTNIDARERAMHSRTMSLQGGGAISIAGSIAPNQVVRYDKLADHEVKDLLICFLYVVKNLAEDILLGWFNNSSETDILDFFHILEVCLSTFKYQGRKKITSLWQRSFDESKTHEKSIIGDTRRVTLPAKKSGGASIDRTGGGSLHPARSNSTFGENDLNHIASKSEVDGMMRAMLEANLSSEVAMIVLDIITLYTINFKDQLQYSDGENPVMDNVFRLYLLFLKTTQSASVQKHAFAALRAFLNKFPRALFCGDAEMCGSLCFEILRCCSSRLKSTRTEACTLMYLVMRANFEFSHRRSFTRVHLQMIVAVSQLIGETAGMNSSRFTDSLSVISSYAHFDKAMQATNFPHDVKDLTRRIRNVLMATAQMREHEGDPEKYVDLQYCLAKSYTSTPELRKTWLTSMARVHCTHGNYSEAAHCYIHIAALMAEYLKRRGEFPQGCSAFRCISSNVEAEEAGMKDDAGMQDVAYTGDNLTAVLEECARLFEQAERYEVLGDIYRLLIPIYEGRRDFKRLAAAYEILHRSYAKIVEVMSSGRRLLGKYFRVAFFGQAVFEEEDGKEYVYKEPKVTPLTDICERLETLYNAKHGRDTVHLIKDSNKVNPRDLDPKLAYIQVTHLKAYFDIKELDERCTDFERNNNVRRFMYETPFTKDGRARGDIDKQFKRRTILTTSHSFPYVTKRILVVYHNESTFSPIEVAIDEMVEKIQELEDVLNHPKTDVKKLQLKLSGSVNVQVNAGPMAYAETFLAEENIAKYPQDKVARLKEIFRDFIDVCGRAVMRNDELRSADQVGYQQVLYNNYRDMGDRVGEMFGEQLLEEDDTVSVTSHRSSMTVFSAISSSSNV